MQFTKTILAAALASLAAAANTVLFINLDGTTRHVVFTPSAGSATIDGITVPGNSNTTIQVPEGWIGNAFSYDDGAENVPGILAEWNFNGWEGITFFDISAIVNPSATDGIIMMYPTQAQTPVSGCMTVSCTNQYNQPDDVATQATTESDFTVILGQRIQTARRSIVDAVARKYVLA